MRKCHTGANSLNKYAAPRQTHGIAPRRSTSECNTGRNEVNHPRQRETVVAAASSCTRPLLRDKYARKAPTMFDRRISPFRDDKPKSARDHDASCKHTSAYPWFPAGILCFGGPPSPHRKNLPPSGTPPKPAPNHIDFDTSEGTWMTLDQSPMSKWIVFDAGTSTACPPAAKSRKSDAGLRHCP